MQMERWGHGGNVKNKQEMRRRTTRNEDLQGLNHFHLYGNFV